jgi:hypothetical protein
METTLKETSSRVALSGLMLALMGLCVISGCAPSANSSSIPETYPPVQSRTATEDGVVAGVWEPPIVDVIQVPPGLDPEGHYYRPAHDEVVEIRQGRWQHRDRGGQ